MSENNVFVEAFTEICPGRLVPVASDKIIEEALEEASRVYSLYDNGDGTLGVPSDWLGSMILDFADWFDNHRPTWDTSVLCRRFGDIPLISELQKYDAGSIIDAVSREIEQKGGISPSDAQQAELLANALLSLDEAMTLTYTTDTDYPLSVFVPKEPETKLFDDLSKGDNSNSMPLEKINHDLIYALCLQCLMAQEGALSICRHNGSTQTLSVISFSEGRCWVLGGAMLNEMVSRLMDDDAALLENLSGYMPSSEFETKCIRLAACISGTLLDAVHDVKESIIEAGGSGRFATFSLCPPAFSMDLDGGVNAFLLPPELSDKPLANLFDGVIELDPLMSGAEASRIVAAAAVTRAAGEILLNGNMNSISEDISDMSFFMELDGGHRPFDQAALSGVSEFSLVLSDRKTEKTMLEMYRDLPAEKKQPIDRIVNLFKAHPEKHRIFVALEGDGLPKDEMGNVSAFMAVLPANVSPMMEDQSLLRLRANCAQCSFAPQMTAFAAFKPMTATMNNPNLVSGLSWKDSQWSSLGAERTLDFLERTNLGEVMDISPGEPLDYMEL